MREAVFFKPDGHEFGRSGKGEEIETKKMSQIGGWQEKEIRTKNQSNKIKKIKQR